MVGWPLRWRAAAMARWRTASGLRVGHAEAVPVERLAQRWLDGPQLGCGGVNAAELLDELEGTFGFAAV
jgi:hypothetical protein